LTERSIKPAHEEQCMPETSRISTFELETESIDNYTTSVVDVAV